ncbi:DNA polymerase III subunit gamma/tau [Schnuerera ultunensis]|uniref:DNA polymerase III (Gamma and tau subunits) n=1 Tax=[Clostridium] ultunense Esp TaxID=1288971 RepID=A0A1M4PKX6_9FIRM
MYQALYRQYRPKTFDEVLGQEHITTTLKNQIQKGNIGHAYLFSGTKGTGKTSTAKIFSRAVNCLNPVEGNPCNECEICKGILDESIMDIIEMDAASNNSVDDIRELRDKVVYPPARAKYKIYIVDEVHMLSKGAFNALLKTLEVTP